jgi:hypothetical protein
MISAGATDYRTRGYTQAAAILVFGSGEAKGELAKRLESENLTE